ncbi:SH3 domain-containing protein [Streptomyces sp. NPDC048560]|uniref:SH3 domain-containing protein n=1 Tax=Streptomyces sp. NPDC048560 TaxID=3155488 RepID=UPI0034145DBD
MRERRLSSAALTVAALAVPAGLVLGTAGLASANASCGQSGPFYDGTTVTMTAGVSANMRSGSSTGCAVRGWADQRDTLVYYCYTWAADGSTWTYLRNAHDGTYGWVKDSLLPNNGAYDHCGF